MIGFTVADAIAAIDDVNAAIELHAPVAMDDLGAIRDMLRERVPITTSVEVTVRGTPDRKYDGDHRVEVRIEHIIRALPVHA